MGRRVSNLMSGIAIPFLVFLLLAWSLWLVSRLAPGSQDLRTSRVTSSNTSSLLLSYLERAPSVQPAQILTGTNHLPVIMRNAEIVTLVPTETVTPPRHTPSPTQTPTEGATPTPTPTTTAMPTSVRLSPFAVTWLSEVHSAEVRQLAAQAGVRYGRVFVDWSGVEPVNDNTDPNAWNSSAVNWSGADSLISNLLTAGMAPIITVTGNPSWAATTSCGPIDKVSLAEFGEFLGAFVERYDGDGFDDAPFITQGSRVPLYSLYNEPDALPEVPPNQGGCWGRHGTEYAQMMQVAWQAMHAADPSVKVATGALAYDNFHPDYDPPGYPGGNKFNYYFLDDMLSYIQSHPGEYFDYLNFNYYELYGIYYWEPLMGKPGIIAKTQYLGQKMTQYGYEKPLINSEVGEESKTGSTCSSPSNSEEKQARYVLQIYARGMAADLHVITWWPMRDYVVDVPGYYYNCGPGLIRTDNSLKPSYLAYQTMTRELARHTYDRQLTGVTGVEGYIFRPEATASQSNVSLASVSTSEKTVLWATGSSATATFTGIEARVVQKDGSVQLIQDGGPGDVDGSKNGQVRLQVGPSPILVGPPGPATPTPTATATVTPTSTGTLTPTPTRTATATPTSTRTPTATPTSTSTATPTPTSTPTATPTQTPTVTPTGSPTPGWTPYVLQGDVNNDGAVDFQDIVELVNYWRTFLSSTRARITDITDVAQLWGAFSKDSTYDPMHDLDHDGDIDVVDVMLASRRWGAYCPQVIYQADFSSNGLIDGPDVLDVTLYWHKMVGGGQVDMTRDVNSDGSIDILDVMFVTTNWGVGCMIP